MLLGIVLHAALFLVPDAWPIVDKKASDDLPYGDVVSAIHGFRMPIFFLLSGLFSAMLVERRGLRGLLRQRAMRVALPLLVGCVTVIPLTSWAWIATTNYDLAKDFPAGATNIDMVMGVWLFSWLDSLQHLWFLWHLLWVVGIYALLVRLGLTFTHRWAWWALGPMVVVLQFFMLWIGADTSDGVVIAPHVLAYYALFFLFGAFMYGRGLTVPKQWAVAVIPALLLLYPLAVYVHRAAISEYDARNEELAAAIWLGGTVVQVAYTWLMCFGLMGLFRWIAATERPWVRYVSDSSYWLYLAHLPLIVVAQRGAGDWDASVHLKFAVIVVASTAVLLVSYHLAIRHTPIGTFLNGPRPRPRPDVPLAA